VGPPDTAASTLSAAPVLVLMAVGIVVAIAGHIVRSPRVVGAGLALVFLATALMFLGGFAAFQGDERDPRPQPLP
jgi:hypothetical protein